MKDQIINIISVIADVFTILGFIIAFITLCYFLKDYLDRLKYESRKILVNEGHWTNETDVYYQNFIYINLIITDSESYIFSGNIELSNHSEKLTFYFQKAFGKSITIKIHKNIGWRDVDLAICLLYTSPSPRDRTRSRMPSSA